MHKVDFLTGLNNMAYLELEYGEYLKKHPFSHIIAIDFTKLKHINDNFGHQIGDECLKLFAKLSQKYFSDSLLIRRSGDEFIFVTYYGEEEIEKNLKNIENDIKKNHEENIIPTTFEFNCGIKKAREDLKLTLLKADITMYYAKNEHCLMKAYDQSFYLRFQHSTEFIDSVDRLCDQEAFDYVYQPIYDLKNNSLIEEIYTRSGDTTLFDERHFSILLVNHRFKKIDFTNLNCLFKNYGHFFNKKTVMINIHFQTFLSTEKDLCLFLEELSRKYKIEPKNIILSINIIHYDSDIDVIREKILELKEFGFKICLDSYSIDDNPAFRLFEDIKIDYIKISKSYLEKAMDDERKSKIAQNLIGTFLGLDTIPIFSNVESKEEENFILGLNNNCYVKGYLYSLEKNIK